MSSIFFQDIRSYFSKSPKAAPAVEKKTKTVTLISSDEDDTRAATSKKEPKKQEKKVSTLRCPGTDFSVSYINICIH